MSTTSFDLSVPSRVSTCRHSILGIDFDLIDEDTVLHRIQQWIRSGEKRFVSLANPHTVMLGRRDAQMLEALGASSLVLPDGVGIGVACKVLAYPYSGRVPGPSLMLTVCDRGREFGVRHFFFGGPEGIAARLADRLAARFPGMQVAGVEASLFRPRTAEEDADLVGRINRSSADIVWVCLGTGRQEKWMASHLGRIDSAIMMGVGAALDFHAGTVPWAPRWIRRAGLEWAYRLLKEPRRLWRRNLDSPLFLAKVLAQRIGAAIA